MAYADLRQFLARLESAGHLTHVPVEVDLAYELGAVVRHAADLNAPAPYFDHVAGHSIPVAANLLGTRERIALAAETSVDRLTRDWPGRTAIPVPPVRVNEGACQERVILGDDIDLRALPIPIFNAADGGPFVTAGCHFSVDPKTGSRNVAIYRNQVHGPRLLGIQAGPYRHLIQQALQAERAGERFPVAIVLGADPSVYLTAAADLPAGEDELGVAGALRGAPVPVVRCRTIPIDVPASAEIVLECELLPGQLQREGPFGEFSGYYGTVVDRPVLEVKAITHRSNPIYHAGYTGKPPCEDVQITAVMKEANILADVTLPGLLGIHLTTGGCGHFNAVASIAKRFEGYGKMMALAILGTWAGRTIKTITIVDEDVDPFNATDVEWALATRVQPHRDVELLRDLTGIVLDPSLPLVERQTGTARTSKMIIDATRYDAASYETVVVADPTAIERVVRDWERYGYSR